MKRSSSTKQVNKAHKGASKGNLNTSQRKHPGAAYNFEDYTKAQRITQSHQKREKSRDLLKERRRGLIPPTLVAIVAGNASADLEITYQTLCNLCDESGKFDRQQFHFTKCSRDLMSILDICKVADVVIVVSSCSNLPFSQAKLNPETCAPFDEVFYEQLSLLRSQGIPSIYGVIQDLPKGKHEHMAKKLFTRYFTSEFPDIKVNTDDFAKLLRTIPGIHNFEWRNFRSYMLAQNYCVNSSNEFEVTGVLRGAGLHSNQIVHITGHGDLNLTRIQTHSDVFVSDNPESMESLAEQDPFASEQSLTNLEDAMASLTVTTDHDPYYEPPEESSADDESALSNAVELEERAKDDMEFPDEVDTPTNQQARIRFQRYRGLKGFKSSAWDPYENLPAAYSRLYEVSGTNKAVKSAAQAELEPQVFSGTLVTLVFSSFPESLAMHSPDYPMILSSLLPYERKMTVCHFSLSRVGNPEIRVESKENITFCAGFRRFDCKPIFSENTPNCDKSKYIKFLHSSGVATIYHPVILPPSNLLVFKGTSLVATGNLHSFDAKRLIIKRILLTGYPIKIHKRKSVIRYMFFDPKDINYFKPIELNTKEGLRGNIIESVGTHGYMKCVFNDAIKFSDTICMPLYKRKFPVLNFEV